MSAPEPTAKRQRVDGEQEELVHGLVIVSNLGDKRPEEIVPDTVATCCLNCSMSVRSYVIVPDFGPWSIFLANYTRKADEEGRVSKRYVKKMIPNTMYLNDITCDVMMLCCHGIPKFPDKDGVHHPHALSFNEQNSVDRDGERRRYGPPSSLIWSCSSYTDDKLTTYTKREPGITLSEVVRGSRLVLLLCCCGGPIMQEYRKEIGEADRPDFVYFAMDHIVHDISINIFLALLITALEDATQRGGVWDEFFRRCVCKVLTWVQVYGGETDGGETDGEALWEFLEDKGCVEMRGETGPFRIKGCINNYGLEHNDKEIVLRELQSITLLLWDGEGAGDAVVNHKTDADRLDEWIYGKEFKNVSHRVPAESPISVDALLLRLKGLLRT